MRIPGEKRMMALSLGFGLILAIPLALSGHEGMGGWRAPEAAQKVKNPVPAAAGSIAKGKEIFSKNCAVCHGEKGDGKGRAAAALNPRPADFTDAAMMSGMTDGELFWKITTGKGSMPSQEKAYRETDRWNLVNYLRGFAKAAAGKAVWTCPMHPEAVSDQPGKCPKCGMNLVEKKPEPSQLQPQPKAAAPPR